MPYNPKRLRPAHLLMIRLHWAGESNEDIAARLQCDKQTVSNIINSDAGKRIIDEMTAGSLDTTNQVVQELQEIAGVALQRKIDMLYSGDDRVVNTAATDLLHMAGHAPTKRVHVTGASVVEKEFEGLSQEEIRAKIAADLDMHLPKVGNGPDGRPLS